MPAGITIWNDSNTVQITDTRSNPVLVQKGTMTTVTNTVSGAPLATSMASLTYTRASSDTYPMLAIRPSGLTGLRGIGFAGTGLPSSLTWTWELLSTQAVGTAIDYWLFDLKLPLTSSQLLEIYDTSGNITFSLAEKPMRVRSVNTGTLGAITSTVTFDSGRTYAMMLTRWTERLLYRAINNTTQVFALGVAGATNGMQIGSVPLSVVSGDATPTAFGDYQIVVMDVTNY